MIDTIIGVDTSLTSAGMAVLELRDGLISGCTHRIRPGKITGHERMDSQRLEILRVIRSCGPNSLVIIERAIPQRQAFALENLGLWWLVTHSLWRNGIDYAQVVASSAKKYITGNGRAEKDEIMVALFKRWTVLAQAITNNDTADAMCFAIMAADWLGWPVAPVPKEQRKSLEAVMWPEGLADAKS